MRKILSRKLVVSVVALTVASIPFIADSCFANPEDAKANAPATEKAKPPTSTPPAAPPVKPIEGTAKQGAEKQAGMHHRGKHGRKGHHDRDHIPSFHAINRLDSLTEVQRSKINTLLKQAKSEAKPMLQRLKQIKQESNTAVDASDAGKTGASATASPEGKQMVQSEASELRSKIHQIRKTAWGKMQKVLTAQQKIELESHRGEEKKHRRHRDEDLMEGSPDKGSSLSK